MPIVKCNVSNCMFWGEGNNCEADSILVEIDAHAENDFQMNDGALIGVADHIDEADDSAETCCHTFQPAT
ncbi:MAG TPA: DUF1540 domain-containing protein [Bacillales bacterium]|nr:DUF1540 domain-containing protein [Bacillales bacterium]